MAGRWWRLPGTSHLLQSSADGRSRHCRPVTSNLLDTVSRLDYWKRRMRPRRSSWLGKRNKSDKKTYFSFSLTKTKPKTNEVIRWELCASKVTWWWHTHTEAGVSVAGTYLYRMLLLSFGVLPRRFDSHRPSTAGAADLFADRRHGIRRLQVELEPGFIGQRPAGRPESVYQTGRRCGRRWISLLSRRTLSTRRHWRWLDGLSRNGRPHQ